MAEGDVVRRVTITATGQGIEDTTNSLTGLGDAISDTSQKARDAQSSYSDIIFSIGGIGVATVGAVAGMKAFVDYAGNQAQALSDMAIDNLWSSAFGGSSTGRLLGMLGLGSSVGSGSVPVMSSGLGAGTGGLSFPMFASGTDSAPGGWSIVGEKGPELMNIPRGAKVLPNGVMPDSGSTSVSIPISIDATGADAAGLVRVQAQLVELKSSLPTTIVTTVKNAKSRRAL